MKKRWMSGTLALLLAGTTVASMMPAVSVKAEGNTVNGTTYYVDSNGGNDSNEGTSEGKAFKTLDKVNALDLEPGDTVLLKKGSVFGTSNEVEMRRGVPMAGNFLQQENVVLTGACEAIVVDVCLMFSSLYKLCFTEFSS